MSVRIHVGFLIIPQIWPMSISHKPISNHFYVFIMTETWVFVK